MNYKQSIYEDQYYEVLHNQKYRNIPGMVIIKPKLENWYSIDLAIERLAILEKSIRDYLLEIGIEIVGIYREQNDEGKFEITMIPYHIHQLKSLGISPDLYQPFIEKYLNSFDNSYINEVNSINKKLSLKLRNVGD